MACRVTLRLNGHGISLHLTSFSFPLRSPQGTKSLQSHRLDRLDQVPLRVRSEADYPPRCQTDRSTRGARVQMPTKTTRGCAASDLRTCSVSSAAARAEQRRDFCQSDSVGPRILEATPWHLQSSAIVALDCKRKDACPNCRVTTLHTRRLLLLTLLTC
jgi:hypothetical protein